MQLRYFAIASCHPGITLALPNTTDENSTGASQRLDRSGLSLNLRDVTARINKSSNHAKDRPA